MASVNMLDDPSAEKTVDDLWKGDKEIEDPHVYAHLTGGYGAAEDHIRHGKNACPGKADPDHRIVQHRRVPDEINGNKPNTTRDQRDGMGSFPPYQSCDARQQQRIDHRHEIVYPERAADLIARLIIGHCFRIVPRQAIDMRRHRVRSEYPHAEQGKPTEELHQSQLPHCTRHPGKIMEYLAKSRRSRRSVGLAMIFFIIRRRILPGEDHRHKNRQYENGRAYVKGVFDIVGNTIRSRNFADPQSGKDIREVRADDRPKPDQEGLY